MMERYCAEFLNLIMPEHFVLYQYPATKHVSVQEKTVHIEGEDCGNKGLRGARGALRQ